MNGELAQLLQAADDRLSDMLAETTRENEQTRNIREEAGACRAAAEIVGRCEALLNALDPERLREMINELMTVNAAAAGTLTRIAVAVDRLGAQPIVAAGTDR